MLKKASIAIAILALLASGIYVFREEVTNLIAAQMTRNMFLDEDLDDYDPGIALTDPFPLIKVSLNGKTYDDLSSFHGVRGLVVLFSRSVVW